MRVKHEADFLKDTELKPCPFCGGEAKLSFKDCEFGGQNFNGDKKIKYRFQVICNKCHSRGMPIKTDWLINPNAWASAWSGRYYWDTYHMNEKIYKNTEELRPWAERAIEAWNRRTHENR